MKINHRRRYPYTNISLRQACRNLNKLAKVDLRLRYLRAILRLTYRKLASCCRKLCKLATSLPQACGLLQKTPQACGPLSKSPQACGPLSKSPQACGPLSKSPQACGPLSKSLQACRKLAGYYTKNSASLRATTKISANLPQPCGLLPKTPQACGPLQKSLQACGLIQVYSYEGILLCSKIMGIGLNERGELISCPHEQKVLADWANEMNINFCLFVKVEIMLRVGELVTLWFFFTLWGNSRSASVAVFSPLLVTHICFVISQLVHLLLNYKS